MVGTPGLRLLGGQHGRGQVATIAFGHAEDLFLGGFKAPPQQPVFVHAEWAYEHHVLQELQFFKAA
jgi:hypothetical protein